jgi:hypothetical protein
VHDSSPLPCEASLVQAGGPPLAGCLISSFMNFNHNIRNYIPGDLRDILRAASLSAYSDLKVSPNGRDRTSESVSYRACVVSQTHPSGNGRS